METATPAVYILSSTTPHDGEAVARVASVLGMTPLHSVFVHNRRDLALALCFLPPDEILITESEQNSITLAQEVYRETHMPSLVIGDAVLLDAIYEDVRRESVNV